MATNKQEKLVKNIIENYGKKIPKNKGELLDNSGYKKASQKNPKLILEGKGVQKDLKPFVDKLIVHREKVMKAMDNKDLDKEQYRVLGEELIRINHDIQLLSGGSTERVGIVEISETIAKKNAIDPQTK